MTPEVLCAATAAARAAAHLGDEQASDRSLEPAHPAFVGFRRTTYIWTEAGVFEPVGDRFRLWLQFLRERAVRDVWLDLGPGGPAVRAQREAGSDVWHPVDLEGEMTMRGRAEPATDRPDGGVDAAGAALRDALATCLGDMALPSLRGGELRRSAAILDSADDGSDVSDVAWPYFLLPETSGAAARRLLAAAAAAWSDPAEDAAAVAAVSAVVAAVNAAAEPSGRMSAGEPVK